MHVELQLTQVRLKQDYMKIKIQYLIIIGLFAVIFNSCKPEQDSIPPTIQLIFEENSTQDGEVVAIGHPLNFKIEATGIDANITNFTIKKVHKGIERTVLDSGLNSAGFVVNKTFYQGVEDEVEWVFTVMDRERKSASTSISIIKDPDSQFGGIHYFPNITLGYQNNTEIGHFLNPLTGEIFRTDSAKLFQELIDILVYFNYSAQFGVLQPSPTFSSPGEDPNGNAEMYDDFYPSLLEWNTRNYTKWDIRADNGVTEELFYNAQNDSLLIVSYDNVWGKKKYKWSYEGLFIPFETAAGKKGIIRVLEADFDDTGTISFSMKIQM